MKAGDIVTGQYGAYQVLEEVGRGAHATVYKALSLSTQGIVALKCLYASTFSAGRAGKHRRDTARARWAAEVDALRAVKEEGTCHVIAYIDHMQLEHSAQDGSGAGGGGDDVEAVVYCIVEEYAAGGTLLQWRRQHPGVAQAAEKESGAAACAEEMLSVTSMIYGVTCALATLRRCGVVHGDVKCANVLLSSGSGGVAKLADFSLATRVAREAGDAAAAERATPESSAASGRSHAAAQRESTRTGAQADDAEDKEEEGNALGSIYWLAPEVARGGQHTMRKDTRNEVHYRPETSSDVWSLGCLCVELLTGRPPYAEYSPMHALYHIAQTTATSMPLPAGLSAAAEDFLRGCFTLDPAGRPTAAELRKHRWLTDARIHAELDALVYAKEQQQFAGSDAAAAALTSTHTTPMLPAKTSPAATIDGLAAWVEHHLFSNALDAWLRQRGVLAKLIAVLARITAEESFSIVRSLAYAAARCCSGSSSLATNGGNSSGGSGVHGAGSWQPCAFLDELGQTMLWEHDNLPVLCTAEDLVTLFRCCCARQSAPVPYYAPTHVRALRFLLLESPDRATTAPLALDALYKLLVAEDTESDTAAAVAAGSGGGGAAAEGSAATHPATAAPAVSVTASGEAEHRRAALQRLRREGGFLLLRRMVENACGSAFVEAAEPALGWPGLDHVLAILHAAAGRTSEDEVDLLFCQRPPRPAGAVLGTRDSTAVVLGNKDREPHAEQQENGEAAEREEEDEEEDEERKDSDAGDNSSVGSEAAVITRRDVVMLPPPAADVARGNVNAAGQHAETNGDDDTAASSTQSNRSELDITHRPESSLPYGRRRIGGQHHDSSNASNDAQQQEEEEDHTDAKAAQAHDRSKPSSVSASGPRMALMHEDAAAAEDVVLSSAEQLGGRKDDKASEDARCGGEARPNATTSLEDDDDDDDNSDDESYSDDEDEDSDDEAEAAMVSRMQGSTPHRPSSAQRWLLALQECSAHGGPHAITLFLHYIQHAAEHGCNGLLRNAAGVSAIGTLLLLASEPASGKSARLVAQRLQMLDCLVALQRISLPARRFIRDRNASVPLLAYILESTTTTTTTGEAVAGGGGDAEGKPEEQLLTSPAHVEEHSRTNSSSVRLQKACVAAVRMLCDGDEQMAAACATSQAFVKAVWAALCATPSEDEDAMAQVLSLLELLCSYAEQRGRGRLGLASNIVAGNNAMAGGPALVPSLQDNKGIAVLERLARSAEQRGSGLVTAAQKLLSVLGVLPHAV